MNDLNTSVDFEQVVRDTQVRVRAYIAGMGIATHSVDDVAQEVYVELYRSLEKIPEGVPIERWVKGIARNLCLNHIRKISRRGRLHREALVEILANTKIDPDKSDVHPSMRHALDGCCEKLPDRSRQILAMRYTEDLSSSAIADLVDSTAEAIRVSLHRIRMQLKDCISRTLARQA